MWPPRILPVAGLLAIALLGCPADTPDGDEPDPCETASADIALADEHNYTFDGALDIHSTPVQPLADLTIDWGSVSHDLLGHDMDPVAEIDSASAIVFGSLSEEEVQEGLSLGTLEQADVTIFSSQEPGDATQVLLSDMTLFGNDFDIETYLEDGSGTWLLNLATGTVPGVGTRMAAFFQPVDGETNTEVQVTDTSTVLDFTVDLASMTEIHVPAGEPALSVDWSELGTDGQGIDIADGLIDQVMVGHYADLTVADLEEQFLDIELIADELYSLDLTAGESLDLSTLVGDAGAFPGIDDQGTWLLALRCMTCINPAPPAVIILHACGE
jgi:hypothetical protein